MENPRFFGQLLIITAPSGAGKTSLIKSLLRTEDQLQVAVSHTTRPIRPGEREGSDYFFVSKESFHPGAGSDKIPFQLYFFSNKKVNISL